MNALVAEALVPGPNIGSAGVTPRSIRAATAEAPWVRRVLIGAALLFLTLFLFVPLVTVFHEASS